MDASLPRKVLVLGARGFLGERIVQELTASGCDVVPPCVPALTMRMRPPVSGRSRGTSWTPASFAPPWPRRMPPSLPPVAPGSPAWMWPSTASNLASAFVPLWLCQGKAPFCVRGGTTFSDVRDVGRAHVAALAHGRSGQQYILGGHCLERGAFYGRVTRLTGLRPPRGVPRSIAFLVTAVGNGLASVSGGLFRSPVHRAFARGEGLYYYGDSHKAVRELGHRVRPLEASGSLTGGPRVWERQPASGSCPACLRGATPPSSTLPCRA